MALPLSVGLEWHSALFMCSILTVNRVLDGLSCTLGLDSLPRNHSFLGRSVPRRLSPIIRLPLIPSPSQ
ncbi:hypothetical protein Hypma_007001 [Hypsizygus marmoreus]|uniref:Uncharacterized protein n=1 Tax=Hypsizygus marmoreus TaxID=39966 RepID=A0A369KHR1_HYPMA|nr:hypothetical protein Hypma_007001 [Hypsizygus marmoreus]